VLAGVFRASGVSEQLVELLQERHDLRQQIDMRNIAIDQLQRLPVTSDHRDVMTRSLDWGSPWAIPDGRTAGGDCTDNEYKAKKHQEEKATFFLLVQLPRRYVYIKIIPFEDGETILSENMHQRILK